MKSRYLYFGIGIFFVFIFALALGATLNDQQMRTFASEHCQNTGGTWTDNDYCEKIISVCQPQT